MLGTAERAKLEDVFRRTTYAAGLSLKLRVGQAHPFLDRMLDFRGLHEWAYLTAWNPGGKKLSEEENHERQEALLAKLRGRHPMVEGAATADEGDWSEESVLVLGLPRADALALAAEFGQVAIVAGRKGGAAELVWV